MTKQAKTKEDQLMEQLAKQEPTSKSVTTTKETDTEKDNDKTVNAEIEIEGHVYDPLPTERSKQEPTPQAAAPVANRKADHMMKINGVFYMAGDELPEDYKG